MAKAEKNGAAADTETMKAALRQPKKNTTILTEDLLSSGSTVLNLACSGKTKGAFAKGFYYLYVGDSDSGKTWVALGVLAEAANNPAFDDYELVHDDVEYGANMDKAKFFGKKAAARIKAPAYDKEGNPVYSRYLEQSYDALEVLLDAGKKVVWIIDSHDALRTLAEEKRTKKNKAVRARKLSGTPKDDDKEAGSYGDGKAKINSETLPRLCHKLKKTGSILIIINQTRANIGIGATYNPTKYSGGHALKFYATLQLWSKPVGKIKKSVLGKSREVGSNVQIRVKKNRLTGRDRSVEIPIRHSYGIDDTRSCIDYLVDEGKWDGKKDGEEAAAPEFGFDKRTSKDKLAAYIEENGKEKELRLLVKDVWDEIENACAVKRKPRYA